MLKGERKALARQLANSKPKKQKTEGAAAVVVNPTHFAIALAYDAETIRVPVVCAKGVDETAREMIAHAESLGIPVIRHVWLARTLYATAKEDEAVPRPTFEATALVIALSQALRASGETHAVLDETALPPGALAARDDRAAP
jgi:type III secretion protein U